MARARGWNTVTCSVCNTIDSLDRDATTMVLQTIHVRSDRATPGGTKSHLWRPVYDFVVTGQTDLIPPHLPHDTQSKPVFNRARIGARHLWHDRFLTGNCVWLSDALALAFRDAGLTGLDLSDEASKQETV